jgi:GNAT superfamily N-acetyltransferase
MALMALLGRPRVADDPRPQRDAYLEVLEAPGSVVLVAEDGGALVGAAAMVIRPRLNWGSPEAWLSDLCVREDLRGRGLGRALVGACVDRASAAGCHLLRLDAGHRRLEAHRLYESLGFVHVGRDYQLPLGP